MPNKSVFNPGNIRLKDVPNKTILGKKGSFLLIKFWTAAERAKTPSKAVKETQMICQKFPIIRRALLYTKI